MGGKASGDRARWLTDHPYFLILGFLISAAGLLLAAQDFLSADPPSSLPQAARQVDPDAVDPTGPATATDAPPAAGILSNDRSCEEAETSGDPQLLYVENVGISLGIANVSCGQDVYTRRAAANVDDVVKVQIWLGNYSDDVISAADPVLSAAVDGTLRAQLQVGEETAKVTAAVDLSLEDAELEFIPGSVTRRRNTVSGGGQAYVTETVPDEVLQAGEPLARLPVGDSGETTVAALFRVTASEMSVTLGVDDGTGTIVRSLTSKGQREFQTEATIANRGNTVLRDIAVTLSAAPALDYVDDTLMAKLPDERQFRSIGDADLQSDGVVVANQLHPGDGILVRFVLHIGDGVEPGTEFRPVFTAQTLGTNVTYNTLSLTIGP